MSSAQTPTNFALFCEWNNWWRSNFGLKDSMCPNFVVKDLGSKLQFALQFPHFCSSSGSDGVPDIKYIGAMNCELNAFNPDQSLDELNYIRCRAISVATSKHIELSNAADVLRRADYFSGECIRPIVTSMIEDEVKNVLKEPRCLKSVFNLHTDKTSYLPSVLPSFYALILILRSGASVNVLLDFIRTCKIGPDLLIEICGNLISSLVQFCFHGYSSDFESALDNGSEYKALHWMTVDPLDRKPAANKLLMSQICRWYWVRPYCYALSEHIWSVQNCTFDSLLDRVQTPEFLRALKRGDCIDFCANSDEEPDHWESVEIKSCAAPLVDFESLAVRRFCLLDTPLNIQFTDGRKVSVLASECWKGRLALHGTFTQKEKIVSSNSANETEETKFTGNSQSLEHKYNQQSESIVSPSTKAAADMRLLQFIFFLKPGNLIDCKPPGYSEWQTYQLVERSNTVLVLVPAFGDDKTLVECPLMNISLESCIGYPYHCAPLPNPFTCPNFIRFLQKGDSVDYFTDQETWRPFEVISISTDVLELRDGSSSSQPKILRFDLKGFNFMRFVPSGTMHHFLGFPWDAVERFVCDDFELVTKT